MDTLLGNTAHDTYDNWLKDSHLDLFLMYFFICNIFDLKHHQEMHYCPVKLVKKGDQYKINYK